MFDSVESLQESYQDLSKLAGLKALAICACFDLSDDALSLLTGAFTPTQFFIELMQARLYVDAVHFLAHGLPKREAIWWAYLCAEATESISTSQDNLETLELIKKWVFNPDEVLRRAAELMAEKLKYKTAASWAAIAIFWSGGSITPVDTPEVMPDKNLCAKAVAGAILLAAALYEPENISKNYERFLLQGVNIANGGNGRI